MLRNTERCSHLIEVEISWFSWSTCETSSPSDGNLKTGMSMFEEYTTSLQDDRGSALHPP